MQIYAQIHTCTKHVLLSFHIHEHTQNHVNKVTYTHRKYYINVKIQFLLRYIVIDSFRFYIELYSKEDHIKTDQYQMSSQES